MANNFLKNHTQELVSKKRKKKFIFDWAHQVCSSIIMNATIKYTESGGFKFDDTKFKAILAIKFIIKNEWMKHFSYNLWMKR